MRIRIFHRCVAGLTALLLSWAFAAGATWGAQAERSIQRVAVKTDPARKVALVIGNANYPKAPLANPANDAESFSAALRELGFEVVTLINKNRTEMVGAIENFKRRLAGSGVGLFYFAGHGVQMEGRNYLLPRDVDMGSEDQVKYNTIRLDDVLDTLAAGGPAVKIVILDACRNNPFERARGGGGGLAAVTDAPEGTLVAYATSPGRVAQDGDGKNGLYTSHLLKAIQQPGLAIEEVFKVTRASVARESSGRQLPWETTSLTGEPLVLRPGAPAGGTGAVIAGAATGPLAKVRGFGPGQRPKELVPGIVFRDCERCPEMVVVPGGTFQMGSPASEAGRQEREGPQREVTVGRFAVGRFEVTFSEWEACLLDRLDGGCDRWPKDQKWDLGRQPVVNVSWEDASRYVVWLTKRTGHAYRLLSEAEWEYVARAGSLAPAASSLPASVDTLAQNKFKVAGMLGNVWEWVEDCANPSYASGVPTDARPWKTGDCARRGLRGGSYLTAPRGLRPAARSFFPVQRYDINIGFRVATNVD